jgi:4-cresol dehydrogenase (hydroxylating)
LHFTWQEHSQPYTQISDALHTLRRKQLITNSISIHNAEKILSLIGRYPYIDTQGKTPLPTDNKQAAIDAIAGGDWFCETAISAPTQTSLDSIRNEISILLNTLDITLHWDAPNQSGPLFHDFTQTACEQTYWRKTDDLPPTLDPDRDNCGVIWLSPIVPWQSDSLSSLYNTTYEYCYQYGFEPLVSFQFPNHRYAYMIIAIVYDRLTPGDDEKAKQLYEKLKHSITKLGYPLYRQGLLGKDHIHTNATVLEKIQTLLDPNAIFQQHSSKK